MAKLKLSGKELRAIGYPEGPVISVTMNVMEKQYKHYSKDEALKILSNVLAEPAMFLEDETLGNIAKLLLPKDIKTSDEIALMNNGVSINIFGAEYIDESALQQMHAASKLPVSIAGALMPDAHSGYGLPIGGVLATENAVIPYGVGVDIGCRMCLSVFAMHPKELEQRQSYFMRELNEVTLFGAGKEFAKASYSEVLDSPVFDTIPFIKGMQGKAEKQLGTSGSGNHFVEFGVVEVPHKDEVFGLEAGVYLGLLSHSGSRGLGANIASHYTKLAREKRRLPKEAANLAWLELDEEEGIEYWMAMNLAGDYASACHHVIHDKMAKGLGITPIKRVENHHNFAWKEKFDDKEVIVHRKGATPAGKNVLGVIPGSMTAPGFIVKGLGEPASLYSASHGAGRRMSRTAAMKSITQSAMKEELHKQGVTLIGGGLDEAPFAYKNIRDVMNAQKNLVETVGLFYPKIVKMDGTIHRLGNRLRPEKGDTYVEGE